VSNNTKNEFENMQIMQCILCYQEPEVGINFITQTKKGIISYYKKNGINFLKNMWMQNNVIAKMFEEEVNYMLKGREKKQ
jgi:hypothetical protein